MPSTAQSRNAALVEAKHRDLLSKYSSSLPIIQSQLYPLASTQILTSISDSLSLNEEGRSRILSYLSDEANLFRFYRRSRYDLEKAAELLTASLLWRMKIDLDLLSLSTLNPLYVTPPSPNPPLFWINSSFNDHYGRPCGVINLRSVERPEEGNLDGLKEYICACMEIVRRHLSHLYSSGEGGDPVLQMCIAIDLAGSGMANLELELLPFLLDLLKNHTPGIVGAVYVLNYGWVHAGMWAVIKRVLPQQALAKIFFPSYQELEEHFPRENIPQCYGGDLEVEVESGTNDVLKKYGRVRARSRANSYESIYEVFYSADSTPWSSRPQSNPGTPKAGKGQEGFKMTPGAVRKLRSLQMSRGGLEARVGPDGKAIGLSVSTSTSPYATPAMTPSGGLSPRVARRADRHVRFSSSDDYSSRIGTTSYAYSQPDELPLSESESDDSGKDGALPPTDPPSGLMNRLRRLSFSSSPKTPEEAEEGEGMMMYIAPPTPTSSSSPRLQVPYLSERLSHRTRRSHRDGHVSPYNANNPFFGYPATFRLSKETPQHLHDRRRWRDLLRTLTYLFVLRILAFHRRIRWRAALVWKVVSGRGGGEMDKRRFSASEARTAGGVSKARKQSGGLGSGVGGKLLATTAVLVLLLRPELRRRTLLRVYSLFSPREEAREVDWDAWERSSPSPITTAKSASYTGLHLRQRLGIKSAPSGGKQQKGRYNPLTLAAGLVGAASLSYFLYTYLGSPSKADDDDDDIASRRSSAPRPAHSTRVRPSLSLTLSPTFSRTPGSLSSLRQLLSSISPLFVVHLILPSTELDLASSISALTSQLGEIQDFDPRRVLEYSQSAGRFALSRALACDCHVELSLPPAEGGVHEGGVNGREQGGEVVRELQKIRRSCGVVVYANLGGGGGVIDELRREGEREGGRDAPNGMRAWDLESEEKPWRELGERLIELRGGWK